MQIEIEIEAIKRENDKKKMSELNQELANLKEERNQFSSKWKREKEIVDKITARRQSVEDMKLEAERYEREATMAR